MSKLFYIEWCDAMVSHDTWKTLDEAIEWADNDEWVISQVGWILNETDEHIVLACRKSNGGNDNEDMFGGCFKIPKTWIRKRVQLSI